jgi:hypothetical protein
MPIANDSDVIADDLLLEHASDGQHGDSYTNKYGSQLDAGAVVVIDPTNDSAFTACTRSGQPNLLGVLTENISNNVAGHVKSRGKCTVLVQGNIPRGNWLRASATAGRAEDSGTAQRPAFGAIGIAMTAYAGGGAGSVTAMVDIDLYTSTAILQILATISSASGAPSLTFSHTTDSGTDLLVVLAVGKRSTTNIKPSSITFNGTSLTLDSNQDAAAGFYSSTTIAELRSPTIGTKNIVISGSADIYRAVAINLCGSLASPFRTASVTTVNPGTSITRSPTSALLDLVLQVVAIDSTSLWTPGVGETILAQIATASPQLLATIKAGAAGTTTMTESGSSASAHMAALAVAAT